MGRPCSICTHPRREAIDAALVAGEPLRGIAARTGTSPSALERHKEHIATALQRATEAVAASEITRGQDLAGQVAEQERHAARLIAEAERVLKLARRRRDGELQLSAVRTALLGLRELHRNLSLRANIATTEEDRERERRLIELEEALASATGPRRLLGLA